MSETNVSRPSSPSDDLYPSSSTLLSWTLTVESGRVVEPNKRGGGGMKDRIN